MAVLEYFFPSFLARAVFLVLPIILSVRRSMRASTSPTMVLRKSDPLAIRAGAGQGRRMCVALVRPRHHQA